MNSRARRCVSCEMEAARPLKNCVRYSRLHVGSPQWESGTTFAATARAAARVSYFAPATRRAPLSKVVTMRRLL